MITPGDSYKIAYSPLADISESLEIQDLVTRDNSRPPEAGQAKRRVEGNDGQAARSSARGMIASAHTSSSCGCGARAVRSLPHSWPRDTSGRQAPSWPSTLAIPASKSSLRRSIKPSE
jgi:hypothetical protein